MVAGQEDQARVAREPGILNGMGNPIAEANTGTTPVRAGYEIDAERLSAWMAANVEGFAGPANVRWDGGGQALIPPGEPASEPPPPTREGSALA